MKHVDQFVCTVKELRITFAAVNLVNLPSCIAGKTNKSDEIIDADIYLFISYTDRCNILFQKGSNYVIQMP